MSGLSIVKPPFIHVPSPEPTVEIAALTHVYPIERDATLENILGAFTGNTHAATYADAFEIVEMECHAFQAAIAYSRAAKRKPQLAKTRKA